MDTAPTPQLILTLLGLLIVIAFSSGTEVAMLSVNRYRVRTRAAAGERRARALERLLAKPDQCPSLIGSVPARSAEAVSATSSEGTYFSNSRCALRRRKF